MNKLNTISIVVSVFMVLLFGADIYIKSEIVRTNKELIKSVKDNIKIYKELHTMLDKNSTIFVIGEDR